jgi:proline iminopeptidase
MTESCQSVFVRFSCAFKNKEYFMGTGLAHELYECWQLLSNRKHQYIYYDQLGSYYSDQPKDTTLWTNERFVEEVEQVRIALG